MLAKTYLKILNGVGNLVPRCGVAEYEYSFQAALFK